MKKLYTLATLLVLTLFSFTAAANSFTFIVNDPSHVKITTYYNGQEVTFEDGNTTIVDGFGASISGFKVEARSGYAISEIKSKSVSGYESTPVSSETQEWNVWDYSSYSDGTTFTITTKALGASTFTLNVDDYTHLESISTVESFDSNTIEVPFTTYDTVELTGAETSNGEYKIKSVKYADGTTESPDTQSHNLNMTKISAGDVVEVETEFVALPTYTIEATDLAHILYVNGKEVSHYNPTGNSLTFVSETTEYFELQPTEGNEIVSVKVDGKNLQLAYGYQSLPFSGNYALRVNLTNADAETVAQGSTITIETRVRTFPKLTFNNAKGLRFTYNDESEESDQDVYEYQIKGEGHIEVSCYEEGKKLKGLTYMDGTNERTMSAYNDVVSIYLYAPITARTYTAVVAESAIKKFTLSADDPSKIFIQVGATYPTLSDAASQEVEFDTAEPTVEISHSNRSNGYKVYSVKVNGVAVERENDYYGSFRFDVHEGDNVEVNVEFPEVDVPVSFTFGDQPFTKIITGVQVGSEEVENWATEPIAVRLGSTIQLSLDNFVYENITVKVGGNTLPYSYGSVSYVVSSEDPINFEITADKMETYTMTIHCEQWQHLNVYRSSSYGYFSYPVTLTGSSTEIEIPTTQSSIYFQGQDGYYITAGPGVDDDTLTAETAVEDGGEVTLVLQQHVRETPVVVYVAETSLTDFSISVKNSKFTTGMDVTYGYWYNDKLEPGYNVIYIGANDYLEFYTSSMHIFANGTKCESSTYKTIKPVPANSVIKVFTAAPTTYNVTFTAPENAQIGAFKDIVTELNLATATHTVEQGTAISFGLVEGAPEYEITVDGELLEPVDGAYFFTVEANTQVVITEVTYAERESDLTVFVQPEAVGSVEFLLADSDRPADCVEPEVVAGYNFFKFAENDVLTINGDDLLVYVDGEQVDASEPITGLTATTVVKVFKEEPQAWTMNYSFDDDVEVEVYHDHVTKVESPNTHSVFHGTHVAIKPVTPSVAKAAPAAKLKVKVNGVELTPNDEGIYEFTATQNVNVAVEKDIPTGIEGILVDGQEADVYNLQGIKVGTTANLNTLTPGIYIINGVKIRL